jgi:hypothetical protein
MGILRFRVAEKELLEFGTAFVEFIRGTTATKPVDVTYSNGTGQNVVVNEIFYTHLTPGTDGYIQVKSLTNQTLTGSGILNLSMTHTVSTTQADQTVSFNYDSSPIDINVNYNSKPVADDIIIDIPNRSDYTFLTTDFTSHYSDFDSDALAAISIYGTVTGYKISGVNYIEGDWILISDIAAGLLTYEALDQNDYYETNNTWKAKDINGNISN